MNLFYIILPVYRFSW